MNPSRREFMALGVGAFVVASLPAALRRGRSLVRRTVPVMGTIADIAVVHRYQSTAHAAIDAGFAELRVVDRTMSRFDSGSDVGRANLGAAAGPVRVSTRTHVVLEEALRWAAASGGRFDPCLGKTVVLWDLSHRTAPPHPAEVRRFAGRDLYRALEIGSQGGKPVVLFHDRDVAIDLGGIAKGYAVDRAVDALRAHGITDGLVNVGGDLYALGRSEDSDPWQIGIRDPDHPNRIIETLEVRDSAAATSGDYIRCFQYRGRRYHHLLDPSTGEPGRAGARSVTVVGPSCMVADAAGTAVFGLPGAAAARLLLGLAPGARVVHSV